MKKPKKVIFVQGWGIWQHDTLVLVGASLLDGLAYAKKKKLKKEYVNWLASLVEEYPDKHNLHTDQGAVFSSSAGRTLLMLKEFRNDWDYWETLLHEIIHLIDFVISEQVNASNEKEARAYTAEYLFRQIRRKVSGLGSV